MLGRVDEVPLFVRHFEAAAALAEGELPREDVADEVRAILADYVSAAD